MEKAAKDSKSLTPEYDALVSRGITRVDVLKWLDSEESRRYSQRLARHREEFMAHYAANLNIFPSSSPPIFSSSTPIEYEQVREASAAGDLAAVKGVLDNWAKNVDSFSISFIPALENKHISVASYLLQRGVPVKGVHFDCAMKHKLYPFLELCLCQGYDINDNSYPFRPTPIAGCLDDEEMTQWFLDHGADPNAEKVSDGYEMGETALSISMWSSPFNTIKLLFKYGGAQSIKRGGLLWYAVNRKLPDRVKVLEYLLAKGAAVDLLRLQYYDRPRPAMEYDWVLGRQTPLHGAARNGYLDVVKLFIAWGADPMMPDSKGRLAIDEARRQIRMKENGFADKTDDRSSGNHDGMVEYLTQLSNEANPLLTASL
ncbi:MAG: hypothetical protein Q9219_003950 [cf. Caloplaca sp. 3 TL-2023]